jgi:transglutaminase-like putative cysteine protease
MTLLDEPTLVEPAGGAGSFPEPRPTRPLVNVEILLFFGLVLLGAAAYEPVFRSWGTFIGPVFGSAAVASLVAVVLHRRHVPARFGVLVSLVALFLFLAYTVLVGDLSAGVVPGSDTVRALRDGIGHGWQRIVDGNLPVTESTPALVWLTTVTWVVSHLTTDVVQRGRLVAVPVIPPLVLFGLSLPLVSVRREPPFWLVASFIGLTLVAILVRAVPDSRTVRKLGGSATALTEFHSRSVLTARLRLGLPVVAACVLVAPLLATVITKDDPFDPRDLRNEITVPESVSDPLGQLKAQLEAVPPRAAFKVDYDNPTDALDVQRVAVLHLDQFDGVRWTSTAGFGEAGNVLKSPSEAGPGRGITQRYTMATIEDPWLPAAGTPLRIDLPNVAYAADSGDLLAPGSVSGLMYELVSRVATPTADDLAGADRDDDPSLSRYLQLDGTVPEAIRTVAAEATAGATTAGDTLTRLEQYLLANYSYDADAPPGHSYGRLERFLTQDRRGTAEQFSAAFAVMARSLGFPTRVAVGYRVVDDTDEGLQPIEFVTSADYHAWAEVRFAELGWVTFDPTPQAGTTPLPPQPETVAPTTVAPAEPPGGQREPQEAGPSEGLPEPEQQAASVTSRVLRWGGAVVALLVVVAIAAVIAILVLKRRRRRTRRSAPDPADRVVGAWDEILDRLSEMRFPVASSMTPRDVARVGQATYGMAAADPLTQLVPVVSRAVFARDEPSAEVATDAWGHTADFERNLAALQNRRQRLRTRLSLRPFRR